MSAFLSDRAAEAALKTGMRAVLLFHSARQVRSGQLPSLPPLAGFVLSTFRTRSADGTEFEYVIQNCNELLVPHRYVCMCFFFLPYCMYMYVCGMYVVCLVVHAAPWWCRLEEIALRRSMQDAVRAAQNRGGKAAALVDASDQHQLRDKDRDRDRDGGDRRVAVSVYGEKSVA